MTYRVECIRINRQLIKKGGMKMTRIIVGIIVVAVIAYTLYTQNKFYKKHDDQEEKKGD